MQNEVNLTLVGLDSNAFSLMGAFQRQARKDGWTPEEIQSVLDEAKSGDYDHLFSTLSSHCVNGGFGTDDDNDDWDDDWDDEEEDEYDWDDGGGGEPIMNLIEKSIS